MSSAGDSLRPEIERLQPGRLGSLWDMLQFNAVSFYRATVHLTAARQSIETTTQSNKEIDPTADMPPASRAIVHGSIGELYGELVTIGARVTAMAAVRLLKAIGDPATAFSWGEFSRSIEGIQSRLRDEFSLISLFVVEPDKAAFYAPKGPLFGPVVASNFPSQAAVEIDEAAKCFALGRSTASAFHSIRTLETAMRAISRCLGIPDPTKGSDRSWFKALGAIEAEMDRRWPKAKRVSGDGVLFEGIHAVLTAMQNPYRNSTMHLETSYNDDDAKHLFEMVKGLMQKVANRMNEDGQPLA